MIDIKELSFSYPGSRHQVYEGLNLSLESDRIYGLLGKNGQGKSTLLYLIAGLLRPKKGSVRFEGVETKRRTPDFLRDIFIVPEEYELPKLSLRQFIAAYKPFYPHFSEEVFRQCLRDFEMPEEPNLKELSMGQKKKVYMSFALAAGTKLLLMDEPTNGLDIPSKSLFRKVVLNNMTEDRTLIISTHQVHDVEQLLDHVVILDESRVKLNASTADLTARYDFGVRQPSEMDDSVIYAEPSLSGNAVIARHTPGAPETQVNLELLFSAVTKGLITL